MHADGVVFKTFHGNMQKLGLKINILTSNKIAISVQTFHIVRNYRKLKKNTGMSGFLVIDLA